MSEVLTVWRGEALLGEGPVWSAAEQALYFVDIKARFVHRIKAETLEVQSWSSPYEIGCIAPRQSGQWICAHQKGFAFLDLSLRGKVNLTPIAAPEAHLPGNRFNDGKCDPYGRFWAGTMDNAETAATGSFYLLQKDRAPQIIDSQYQVTNGPAFSLDARTAYTNDSARRLTYAFDLSADGLPANRRVWLEHDPADGYPDGMTTDAEGCLWIAFWSGAKVVRFDPHGKRMSAIAVPVPHVTSCAFGGPNLDRLYITSASVGLTAAEKAQAPLSGAVFACTPGVKGLPAFAYAG